MSVISWTDEGEEMYLAHLRFLLNNFPASVAIRFDERLENLLRRLGSFGELCPASSEIPHLRKCLIDAYNSLIYRIEGENIKIIAIVDNRSNHGF